jgi:acyl-CoA synthetase (AMP-forming)/AMP-acid ligase II
MEAAAGAGKKLALLAVRNDLASLEIYLAALELHYAVALFNSTLAPELLAELLDRYQPEIVYAEREVVPGYEPAGAALWRGTTPSVGELAPHLALLLSTSGSTGSPKLVRLTAAALQANAASICQALGITAEDRTITSLPMSYSYGLSVVNSHLLAGASLVLTDEGMLTSGFWDTMRRREVTSLAGVPYNYQMLERLDLNQLNVPALRVLTQAGGKLDERRIERFHTLMQQRGGRFYVMYGQTEATARIAILPSEALPAKLGSAGMAIAGGRFYVDQAEGEETGELVGELIYEGPNVMLGYAMDRSDLALGDELGGRLRTGDLARVDADGFVYILGRAKRDAKLFGLRVNLDEVEGWMKVHGPTGVISTPDKLHLFCEYGDNEKYESWRRELASRMRINVNAFVFHHLDQLPLNDSGKIDYQNLRGRL